MFTDYCYYIIDNKIKFSYTQMIMVEHLFSEENFTELYEMRYVTLLTFECEN